MRTLAATRRAIWKKQFAALRDGDRFFYLNDPDLATIAQTDGITYRHTLADLIGLDAGIAVSPNFFEGQLSPRPPSSRR